MELQELYALMDRFSASGLSALEWQEGESRVSLRRELTAVPPASPAPVPAVPAAPGEEARAEEGEVVSAPLVGVFYAAPAPEEPPYVTAGAQVKKGDTLWAIAAKYYGKGSEYSKIAGANTDKISNPNLIYPGQVLTLP